MIITDEQLQKARETLWDTDTLERVTREARFAEAWVKVVKAIAMKSVEGPVNAQEREALASPEYKLAITEEAKTAGELAKAKAMREAAAMDVEMWRSQQADRRKSYV